MRPILHGDVVAAARVLYALPDAERAPTMERLIVQARRADRYRKEMGRVHPFWGDGSLLTAALAHNPPPEPALADTVYCACLAHVFEALVTRARNSRMSERSDQAPAA